MNIIKTIILILIISISPTCKSQEKDIDNIIFRYSSARRIPFNKVEIEIWKRVKGDSAQAHIETKPGDDNPKWKFSKISRSQHIDIEKFNYIKNKLSLLEKINMDKAYEWGMDGNTCRIEFGAKGRNISYEFWIPKSYTKERGLDIFVELCEEILVLVNLDPNEILEN